MNERVRTFFAVALSEEAREAAAQLAGRLRGSDRGEGVRWVRPEGYHLTLRFLGNVAREAIGEIAQRVTEQVAPLAPFAIHLDGALVFPSPRNPRVIALAVEPEATLTSLAERVEHGVAAAGLPAERRRFRAHLTLGRVRNRRFPSVSGEAAIDCPAFPVGEIVLFQSDLRRTGAVYTPLERIALRGRSPGEGAGSEPRMSEGGLP
jgi:RNA 2',3'-cyclic 3'-phosphodiesterase